jgi:hypothetical protein
VQRRKNSHIEGLATHDDPELCGYVRKDVLEALAGAHAGWVLSLENEIVPGAEAVTYSEGNTRRTAMARCDGAWRGRRPRACVETLCARTGRPCNRPRWMEPWAAMGSPRTQSIDARSRESDCPIVPTKFPNKGREKLEQAAMANLHGHERGNAGDSQGEPKAVSESGTPRAEGMEGRGRAKGNANLQNTHRTLSRASVHSARDRIRQLAKVKKEMNWLLDADIRGFFDAIDHGWLVTFIEHRVAARCVVRLIQKWLNAGALVVRIVHPYPGQRFYLRTQGRSPVR